MAAVGLAALTLATGVRAASGGAPGPGDLLPDLFQETPQDIGIQRVAGRQLLGFRSAVQNIGAGRLAITGARAGVAVRDMRADQLITRADGSVRRVAGIGFVRYVSSPDHSHWHFLPFERYELRGADSGRRVARDRKSGFCLGDRYRVEPRPPRAARVAAFASNCGLGRTDLLRIREGISVGWADDYGAYLDSQVIDVTGVPQGRYRLVHTVNASGRVVEADHGNNTASVLIALTRSGGRVRVRVLRAFPAPR